LGPISHARVFCPIPTPECPAEHHDKRRRARQLHDDAAELLILKRTEGHEALGRFIGSAGTRIQELFIINMLGHIFSSKTEPYRTGGP
jgi:hypothetical protein